MIYLFFCASVISSLGFSCLALILKAPTLPWPFPQVFPEWHEARLPAVGAVLSIVQLLLRRGSRLEVGRTSLVMQTKEPGTGIANWARWRYVKVKEDAEKIGDYHGVWLWNLPLITYTFCLLHLLCSSTDVSLKMPNVWIKSLMGKLIVCLILLFHI